MASAISSIANYSSTIPQAPGDPDAKPVVKETNNIFFCTLRAIFEILYIREHNYFLF